MDKSAFFKFNPEEETIQGIVYILIEIFKIRSMLNLHPKITNEYFNQKWSEPIMGYRIIKNLCKLKCSGFKKIFKVLPVIECEDDDTKEITYCVLALTACKPVAETIFDRLIHITIVCQVFKPMLTLQKHKDLNWNHQAVFTLFK